MVEFLVLPWEQPQFYPETNRDISMSIGQLAFLRSLIYFIIVYSLIGCSSAHPNLKSDKTQKDTKTNVVEKYAWPCTVMQKQICNNKITLTKRVYFLNDSKTEICSEIVLDDGSSRNRICEEITDENDENSELLSWDFFGDVQPPLENQWVNYREFDKKGRLRRECENNNCDGGRISCYLHSEDGRVSVEQLKHVGVEDAECFFIEFFDDKDRIEKRIHISNLMDVWAVEEWKYDIAGNKIEKRVLLGENWTEIIWKADYSCWQ